VRTLAAAVTAAALATGCAGCRDAGPGERELLRAVGSGADVVVVVSPRRVDGTWLERAAYTVAPSVPRCVRERARRAVAVAIILDQQPGLPSEWSIAMVGRGATAATPDCEGLHRDGALAWWGYDFRRGSTKLAEGLDFKKRWDALGDAPVRAIADVEVQSGIVVKATGTLDPRDGVEAHARLRFPERMAAMGAMTMIGKARRTLDRGRLGGAWPAFEVRVMPDPDDPDGATLTAELTIAGAPGADAMLLAAAAVAGGTLEAPRAPCHVIADDWKDDVRCDGNGPYVISEALRDRMLDDPVTFAMGARVVPAVKNGAAAGFKLYAIRPSSIFTALGFENGDRIHTIHGIEMTTFDTGLEVFRALRMTTGFTVDLERRGNEVTLRYEVR
jgi:hypothetical protein